MTALAGCAAPDPGAVPEPSRAGARAPRAVSGEDASPVLTRVLDLSGGFVHVELRIPQTPPGRKPVVIGPLGLEDRLLARGIAVADLTVDWSVFAEPAASADEDEGAGGAAGDEEQAAPGVGAWMLAAPRPGIVGRTYFALIGATAERVVPQVVDRLAAMPEIDASRIGIAGSSTQGFIALEAMAREPRIAAAVVRVACGDYQRFLRSSSLGLRDDPRWLEDGALVLDADYEAELRAREPIRQPERYPPRPLLMLNGSEDPAVPRACAERTAAVFDEAYEEAGVPERFRFVLFEGAAHDLGAAAADHVLAWWTRWLLEAPRE